MARISRGVLALVLSAAWCATALAAPAAAGGGGCHATQMTDKATTEVKVAENCFTPTVVRVDEGETVTWFSGEFEAPHTVTGVGGGFGSDDLPAEGRVSFAFNDAGVYPYACLLHPGMVGAVVVGDGAPHDESAAAPGDAGPEGSDAAGTSPAVALTGAAVALSAGAVLVARRRRLLPG